MGTSEMSRSAYRSVIAAEQTNDLGSAKESGSIEYLARILFALRNVPDTDDLLEVRFSKNKHGPVHRQGDPGLHLRIDRSSQTITEAKDYVPPAADDANDARAAARDRRAIEDAGTLAVALAKHPGIGAVELERKAKAATRGGMGHDRFSHARGMLGDALIELQGPRTMKPLFLDGSLLPPEVLDVVPLANRPAVAASRPPCRTEASA